MNSTAIIVNLAGLFLIGLIVWYFWLWKGKASVAEARAGFQEVDITVKGGYQPSEVVVKAGLPLRLNFTRRESSPCGEEVILPDFGKRAYLPENRTVLVEIFPEKSGEYEFTCGMNMYRGKLVVE